ncbi:hypothetical protein BDB00DRAFT_842465 [Zychaea mexicana]|uniref:uncharacterized protein n=1 Tax=Zychaea mexicana TaxID=64656 RepID=UPI0022FE0704|nr:uncharacterized protein BDB00DRAFT_842465 [Zychaea mexicana]KAI9489555.1 hypothetical protein BDB00DRAFT_842465 [Zychaea mexicana]
MLPDEWSENLTFRYSTPQFSILNHITIAVSSVSLLLSLVVVIFYAVFWYYERKKADRVSLRCVALGSISNVIDTVLDIASSVRRTDQTYCRVLGLIVDFLDVINAGFLAVIGVNLFLIFVFKIKRSERLERFYYPAIFVYSITTMIVPVIEESQLVIPRDPDLSCWYYNHIGDRESHFVSWMYYYALIFFIALLGLFCSMTAVVKLFRQEAANFRGMRRFSPSGLANMSSTAKPRHDQSQDRQRPRSSFPRVVMRCITYTLVPFLIHIWGFAIQIRVSTKRRAPYGLTVVSTIMSSAEGLLTGMVFFSEPVVVSHIKEKMSDFYRAYGEEFSVLEEYGHGASLRRRRRGSRVTSGAAESIHSTRTAHSTCSQYVSNLLDKRNLVPRPAIVEKEYHPQVDLGDGQTLAPPILTGATPPSSIVTSVDDEYADESEVRTIPMRRVSVSSSVYSRIRNEYERRLSDETNTSTLVNDAQYYRNLVPSPDAPDEVFIPYRSPALARAAHWMFVKIDRLRGRRNNSSNSNINAISNQRQQQEQSPGPYGSDGDSSIWATGSNRRTAHSAPEVVVQAPSMPSVRSAPSDSSC